MTEDKVEHLFEPLEAGQKMFGPLLLDWDTTRDGIQWSISSEISQASLTGFLKCTGWLDLSTDQINQAPWEDDPSPASFRVYLHHWDHLQEAFSYLVTKLGKSLAIREGLDPDIFDFN